MYLNTGLTSTKNYGKTILTKVRGAMCVRVCVCVYLAWISSRAGYSVVSQGTTAKYLRMFHSWKK